MHGIPLPPLGSFEFRLIEEGIQREKSERISFVRFLSRLIGPLSGRSPDEVDLLVTDYAEEVFQFRYNSQYRSVRSRIVRQKVAAHDEERRILDKVAAMTVK